MTLLNFTFARSGIPDASNLERARVGVERLRDATADNEELNDFVNALCDAEEGRALLAGIFGNSPFLGQCLLLETSFFRDLLEHGPDIGFARLLDDIATVENDSRDIGAIMSLLRVAKRRAALLIALADISGTWDLDAVTDALTTFAENSLQLGLSTLLRDAHEAGDIVLPHPESPQRDCGYVVLGMGKLGACELNYSSDIDLIVLYDPEKIECPDPDRLRKTLVRLTRSLMRVMDERTADGYVFRTDLRIRPDPSATPLAISIQAAEDYYESMGQNWERAAMIKARPVAGDIAVGASFLKRLWPYIWRRNLDFAAIEDIRSIKRQITAHRGGAVIAVNGHNVKLGRGGIREIEFFAQTQQLIWGGRNPGLRGRRTCDTISDLAAHGQITQEVADELIEAYEFLRGVEHRIQMIDDAQTHDIPQSDENVANLATFLGYESEASFRIALLHYLGQVERRYAELFDDSEDLGAGGALVFTGADDHPDTVKNLEDMGFADGRTVSAIVRAWHHGRYNATRSERARQILTGLTPRLLQAFADATDPNAAIIRFDSFLQGLPAGVQLFSLFTVNPSLLSLVAEIMGNAPHMADWLRRNPSCLDAVLTPDFINPERNSPERPGDAALASLSISLEQTQVLEDVMDAVRRWTNDSRFQTGVQILQGLTDGAHAGATLSAIADAAIKALWLKVQEEFAGQHGRVPGGGMAILALGKLGGCEMAPRSDLDLVFVYDHEDGAVDSDGERPLAPSLYFTRLSQRLISAISAQTGEGALYEIDMRLRPSGNKGPIASRLEGFDRYHAESAWTWENMALTRARIVESPPELAAKISKIIDRTLTHPRDNEALRADVAKMRARIEQEHSGQSPWDLKYRPGGLVDIEFLAQFLMLRHAAEKPSVLSTNTNEALEGLRNASLLDEKDAETLLATLRLWQNLQTVLRLAAENSATETDMTQGQQKLLIQAG
ncbi:MAG: bifunctional [glutamine synthetase] adenylyltransferase/[glutamine synthetase]-adenylyl-L-tyrosine phosphorylase, partial [Alphaproteobacteria bacterium]|nr:bifunctional [glutamine synthetase] adenylyltransferase/[glutamine synthetase]-adenylyl-L-tyrosine phosphorylase [Alphaproteobacteria bacterium]